eukprot:5588926-Prymnesium_polylepis.2
MRRQPPGLQHERYSYDLRLTHRFTHCLQSGRAGTRTNAPIQCTVSAASGNAVPHGTRNKSIATQKLSECNLSSVVRGSGTVLALLSRCRPKLGLAPKADPNEQETELDAGAKQPSHLQHTVPTKKPAQHRGLERNLLSAVHDADAEKSSERLRGNTVNRFAKGSVEAVSLDHRRRRFGVHFALAVREQQRVADRAEASYGVDRNRQTRRARIRVVRRTCRAAELRVVPMAGALRPIKAGASFAALG